MKFMSTTILGFSLVLGTATLSFGAQDPAAPVKTETKTMESAKTTIHKAKKHPKKVTTEQKSTTTSTTAAPAAK